MTEALDKKCTSDLCLALFDWTRRLFFVSGWSAVGRKGDKALDEKVGRGAGQAL